MNYFSHRSADPGNVTWQVSLALIAGFIVFTKDLLFWLGRRDIIQELAIDVSLPIILALFFSAAAVAFFFLRLEVASALRQIPFVALISYWLWLPIAEFLRGETPTFYPLLMVGLVALLNLNREQLRLVLLIYFRTVVGVSAIIAVINTRDDLPDTGIQTGLGILAFREAGPFSHPNVLGYVSAAAILIEVIAGKGWLRRIAITGSLLLLVASQSAGALLALFVALVGATVAAKMRGDVPKGTVCKAPVGLAAFAIFLLLGLYSGGRLSTVGAFFSGRQVIWSETLSAVIANPLIGPGQAAITLYGQPQVHAHNDFVQALAVGGVVALVLLFLVFATAVLTPRTKLGCAIAPIFFLGVYGLVEVPLFPSISVIGFAAALWLRNIR